MARNLVIFDVDGTLTRSSGLDADCFCRAVSECLGISVDPDWSQYRYQTDSGILSEILVRHRQEHSRAQIERVKRKFLELLQQAWDADPSCCTEVPGARSMLHLLGQNNDVRVAIATGAWADSARLKLKFAGIEIEALPFASADDALAREEILEIAIRRAATVIGAKPRTVTYVGDAPWDVVAARTKQLQFVGVAGGSKERRALEEAGAETMFSDFNCPDALRKLREATR